MPSPDVPARRARRPARAPGALAAVLLVVLGAAGCAAEDDGAAPPAAPPSAAAAAAGVLAERHARGGVCAEGPCRSDLVVRADGSWTLATEAGTTAGRLPAAGLAGLETAVAGTGLADDVQPAAGCDADADGTSVEYVWQDAGGDERTASTCEQLVPDDDPLVRQLDAVAADGAPSSP